MSREELLDVILYYDKRGDKKIDVSQVGTCLRSLGLTPTEEKINNLTAQWKNKDARLTVEDLLPIYNNLKNEQGSTPQELAFLLKNFDREGNGFIHVCDLRNLLVNTGEKLTEEAAAQLLHGFEDNDGKVNIDSFIAAITSA